MVKLSICIATLNRGDTIGETLDSLVSQLTSEVELVVVDGASTDDTPEVVGRYRERCASLRYERLERAGGIDRDYCRAVELARGEFCWLMTDDDVLVPGAVSSVLSRLQGGVDAVLVNAEVRDTELREVLLERLLPATGDRAYSPAERETLFRDTAHLLTFIGSVVVRRSLWQAREKERYLGSEFVHVGVIFQAPLDGDAVLIADPLVRIRYGNALWSDRALRIWMFQWPELVWSFPGISDDAKAAVWKREPWNDIRFLIASKARGQLSREEYRRLLRDVRFRPFRRALALLIAYFPDRLFNRLLRVLAPLLRPTDKMLRFELRASRFGPRLQTPQRSAAARSPARGSS